MSRRQVNNLEKALRILSEDPDYHPAHRYTFQKAADMIRDQADEIEALQRLGDDHG